MTESYYATNNIQDGDPGVAKNPQSIFDDPEFTALNPTFTVPQDAACACGSLLFSILTQSGRHLGAHFVHQCGSGGRAWLNGTPDPWGMVVNPAVPGSSCRWPGWPPPGRLHRWTGLHAGGQPVLLCSAGLGADERTRPAARRQPPGHPGERRLRLAVLHRRLSGDLQQQPGDSFLCRARPGTDRVTVPARAGLLLRGRRGTRPRHRRSPELRQPGSRDHGSSRLRGPPGVCQPQPRFAGSGRPAHATRPRPRIVGAAVPRLLRPTPDRRGRGPGAMLMSTDVPTRGLPQVRRVGVWQISLVRGDDRAKPPASARWASWRPATSP